MFFHPANNAQGALESIWVPVHCAWFLSYLLIACSFIPLYSLLVKPRFYFANISYWLAFIGTFLPLPIAAWDSFIVPYLAKYAPEFIAQIEEVSTESPVLIFRLILFLTVVIFSLGFIFYGITLIRKQLAPMIVGVCLSAGAPLFWIVLFFSSKLSGESCHCDGCFFVWDRPSHFWCNSTD
jgi:hypothetical protein